jgi:hypothetical protein
LTSTIHQLFCLFFSDFDRNRAAIARYLRATVIVFVKHVRRRSLKRAESDASDFAGSIAYGLAGADC